MRYSLVTNNMVLHCLTTMVLGTQLFLAGFWRNNFENKNNEERYKISK
jgi:hypothetical protein